MRENAALYLTYRGVDVPATTLAMLFTSAATMSELTQLVNPEMSAPFDGCTVTPAGGSFDMV